MGQADPIAPLIPWYANGTLAADEREGVDRHLPQCASCRELLERARDRQALGASRGPAEMLEHVHPRLLVEYAERPGRQDAALRRWIESRLEACTTCRKAFERLREVETQLAGASSAAAARPAGGAIANLWASTRDLLTSTLLRPAPALAYLVALALLLPALWLAGRQQGEPAGAPRLLVAHGEGAVRGTPGDARPLVVPPSEDAVLLELRTELLADDIDDPDASFELELRRGDRLLWSRPAARDEFVILDGRAALRLLVYPGRLDEGPLHEISLSVRKPGDPLDGQALFRRSFRVTEDITGGDGRSTS